MKKRFIVGNRMVLQFCDLKISCDLPAFHKMDANLVFMLIDSLCYTNTRLHVFYLFLIKCEKGEGGAPNMVNSQRHKRAFERGRDTESGREFSR